jgi:DNA-binding cell septation regulator SpoVG
VTPVELRDVVRGTDPADRVKLTATVVLGAVAVRFVRLVEGRRGAFVSLPARRVDERWVQVVELSDSLRGRVRDALMAALRGAPRNDVDDPAWPPPPPEVGDPPGAFEEVMT